MSVDTRLRPDLPKLPLEEWEPTKDTLHLWAQIVGKVRMASTAPRNHWWHVPLYVDVRGLTTRDMHSPDGLAFEIDFDLVDHRLVVRTSAGAIESFELADGLSVADFDRRLHETLRGLGIDVAIREVPFGVPMATPFPDDRRARLVRPGRGRAFLADPRLVRPGVRGVRRLVLRQGEPGAPVLAFVRPRADVASTAVALRPCRTPIR